MKFSSKLLEQIAFNTRPKTKDYILILMDKSTQDEHLVQPLQTNNKQYKKAVTFLSDYNGFFNVTNTNNKFCFKKRITDEDGFIQITILPGAYGIESLNNEIKRITTDEAHFTEANHPFTIKPNFSTLGSILEIPPQGPIIGFMFDDSKRDLLGFNSRTLYEEYKLSNNPDDKLSFDNFLECDIAIGMIFRGKRFGIFHIFTLDVDPSYNYFEIFRGGVQWYIMESKDIISSNYFKLKNENYQLLSFNGQSINFPLSIKEI